MLTETEVTIKVIKKSIYHNSRVFVLDYFGVLEWVFNDIERGMDDGRSTSIG